MVCTHCGGAAQATEYRLRFDPAHRDSKEIELRLCEACLDEMLGEPAVTVVALERQVALK